jgi:hypothetical protein
MDLMTGNPEYPQEGVQDSRLVGWRLIGIVTVQVHEELDLSETAAPEERVTSVNGQLGLSYAGHAVNRRDHNGRAAPTVDKTDHAV